MKVAIIGASITGMSAADVLLQRGMQCTLYEAEPQVGGLVGSFVVNDVYLEKLYHHLFTSDTAATALIERLGLDDRLEWLPTSNSFYANRIYRPSTPLALLRFSHLSLWDRIRVGLMYVRTRFVQDWATLPRIGG